MGNALEIIADLLEKENALFLLRREKETIATDLLSAEIKAALTNLDIEYDPSIAALESRIEALRQEAKAAVLAEVAIAILARQESAGELCATSEEVKE